MSMNPGRLNRRVTIQSRGATADDYGQMITDWTDVATVWADVRYVNGKEYTTSGTEISSATVSVRIRYRKGITAGMRVLLTGRALNIKAVLPDESGREHVDLVCETGANNG